MVERLLVSLADQTRLPDEILVVDSSPDPRAGEVVETFQGRFPPGVLRWITSEERGLTLQRNVGIDNCSSDLIAMLDDDVVLEPDCLEVVGRFMDSPEGREYGGLGFFITNEFGKSFYRHQRLYSALGIFDGELRPGRWLYCGAFLELSTLEPFRGIYRSEFIPGAAVWRREVFERVRHDSGYRLLGEDKHFSLRVSQLFPVGVLGEARLAHLKDPGGARRRPLRGGMITARGQAVMLRQCDPRPSWIRYLAFMAFGAVDILRAAVTLVAAGRWRALEWVLGSWLGWLWNLLPPRRGQRQPLPGEDPPSRVRDTAAPTESE